MAPQLNQASYGRGGGGHSRPVVASLTFQHPELEKNVQEMPQDEGDICSRWLSYAPAFL